MHYAPPAAMQAPALDQEARMFRKLNLRIIPFLFICYVVAYLDRINIGFVKLQMQDSLQLSEAVYGLGAGLFFIGYVLFEVPSNLVLKRVGARRTLFRIMVLWGIAGCCMALVKTPMQFYICRFLLGVFEAGFVPGAIYYINRWYPSSRRGAALGVFLSGIPIAGMVGGPLSGLTMTYFNGVLGWGGWQWTFVVQAIPAIVLGVAAFFLLNDEIRDARWLTPGERDLLQDLMAKEEAGNTAHGAGPVELRDVRVYLMAIAYMAFICGTYTLSFWLPTLLRNAGAATALQAGLYSAIPFGLGAIGMVLLCRRSDRTMERRWHTAMAAVVGAIALALIPFAPNTLAFACLLLTVGTTTIYGTVPLFWAMPTDYLAGSPSAAGTLAFITSIGLIGGFVSPIVLGAIKDATGSLNGGLYATSALLVLGAVLLLAGVSEQHLRRQTASR